MATANFTAPRALAQKNRRTSASRSAPPASVPLEYLPPAERLQIDKALEILGSYMRSSSLPFSAPSLTKNYLCLQLGNLPHEVFGVMFLDGQNRLIVFEQMFRGTLTETSVYPREVVIQALKHGAAAVVLAHNHPSGALKPSRADIALTDTLRQALALVDVRVLDHIIVGGNAGISMAEQGLL